MSTLSELEDATSYVDFEISILQLYDDTSHIAYALEVYKIFCKYLLMGYKYNYKEVHITSELTYEDKTELVKRTHLSYKDLHMTDLIIINGALEVIPVKLEFVNTSFKNKFIPERMREFFILPYHKSVQEVMFITNNTNLYDELKNDDKTYKFIYYHDLVDIPDEEFIKIRDDCLSIYEIDTSKKKNKKKNKNMPLVTIPDSPNDSIANSDEFGDPLREYDVNNELNGLNDSDTIDAFESGNWEM